MAKVKVRVELTQSALKEFKAIQNHRNKTISEWGEKYLQALIEIPAQGWSQVRERWDQGVFKVGDFIPFDIRGKVDHAPDQAHIRVLVTRFELKQHHSRIWFERLDESPELEKMIGNN